jgi:hypothetical protein
MVASKLDNLGGFNCLNSIVSIAPASTIIAPWEQDAT